MSKPIFRRVREAIIDRMISDLNDHYRVVDDPEVEFVFREISISAMKEILFRLALLGVSVQNDTLGFTYDKGNTPCIYSYDEAEAVRRVNHAYHHNLSKEIIDARVQDANQLGIQLQWVNSLQEYRPEDEYRTLYDLIPGPFQG